ncbi:SGNH/GDSL hydrolase family protein [Ktedonosporobacter rubrisoli]|nr:SGNH/GDSL hydrolase family protein [Ktedonosporobacter rubrisoli]
MKPHRRKFLLAISLAFVVALLVLGTFWTLGLFNRSAIAHEKTPDHIVRIMPLGDSITAGDTFSKGFKTSVAGGYRTPLWSDCMQEQWHVVFVGSQVGGPASLTDKAHEGHPGWRIDQISAHVVSWLRMYQPDIILLQIGTNDILQHYHVNTAPARLSYLLAQISSTLPLATTIVAQITPLGQPQLDAQVVAFNRTIPLIVKSIADQGRHIEYTDMYDAVPESDLSDGIHPNSAGYVLMATVWFDTLRPRFATTQMPAN